MVKSLDQVFAEFGKVSNKSFGGWIGGLDKPWLVEFLQQIPEPKTVVEIGLFMGGTSNILLFLTGNSKYYGIDSWKAGDHQAKPAYTTLKEGFIDQTLWAKDRIILVEGDSTVIGKTWNTPIDLLFVDGDHDYETARADIENFSKWIPVGGYMLIDDYEMEGVIRATDELVRFSDSWEKLRIPDYGKKGDSEKIFAARRIK